MNHYALKRSSESQMSYLTLSHRVSTEPCGGHLDASDAGYITSPGYPLEYPPLQICRWVITVPESSQRIVLNFNPHFELEKLDCRLVMNLIGNLKRGGCAHTLWTICWQGENANKNICCVSTFNISKVSYISPWHCFGCLSFLLRELKANGKGRRKANYSL